MMEHPDMPWTDEMLMAFADGEVGPAEAGAIAAAAATDATLAARIDMFRQTRARIAALRDDTALAAPGPAVGRIFHHNA
jgi:anti-sigma factor RsiW